jgi:hypothetical protein
MKPTKQMLHTAVLLREIMMAAGVSIDETLSSGGTAYTKPKLPATSQPAAKQKPPVKPNNRVKPAGGTNH